MFRMLRALAALLATMALVALVAPPAASAHVAFQPLNGDGSSWAGPAIDQWGRDVYGQGIRINFNPDGSAAGRQNYLVNQSDFAATDVQYLTQGDPFGGGVESPYSVAYSYIPIVAGGTSFLYNLTVGGQKITDLRLSGETLTKIFTGQITNWDDPAIAKDYGRALPSQPITVITRSDGSGASYQFTRWMSKEYTSQWNAFCASHGGPKTNCGPTEFYPGFAGSQQRNGSDQVANYITASYGEGSIGYDEYAYALESNIPVVKVLNTAGYYTLPTPSNVAIALQSAQINENPKSVDFLIQNLDKVYTNPDPRAYPLSSYSYLIVPRKSRVEPNGSTVGPPARFNTARGATLSTWLNYVLCGAQQTAGQLGYSPLPKNLVVGGFHQSAQIPGHVAIPNLQSLNNCNNPTYHNGVNYLVKDAPFPSACDKVGAPLGCTTTTTGGGAATTTGGGSTSGGSGKGTTTGGGNGNGTGDTTTGGGTTTTGGGQTAGVGPGTTTGGDGSVPSGTTSIDPDTGQVIGQTTGTGTTTGGAVFAEPVSVNGDTSADTGPFEILAAVEIVAAILIPGLLGTALLRRRRSP